MKRQNKAKGARNKAKHKSNAVEGLLRIGARRNGFVTVEGHEEEIKVEHDFLNTALHGDTVRLILHPKRRGAEMTGEVAKIIKRAKTHFVGTLKANSKEKSPSCFLLPDDHKLYQDIFIARGNSDGGRDGDKVVVELTNWKSPKQNPEGRVVEVLGRKGDHEAEIKSIMASSGIVYDFPESVEREARAIQKEAKKLTKSEADKRRDFRKVATFTIDPADAKDFDDALSYKELKNGRIEVGIHIADVSFFVKYDSELDREAEDRANSVYLVDRTIPMLPEALSNDICSLRPNEDRLAYSAVVEIDKDGKVYSSWFGRSIIHSQRRFTYRDAQDVIDSKKGDFANELVTLNSIAKRMKSARIKNGSIIFDREEVRIKLDGNNKPVDIVAKENLDTHSLIEEFMLLANVEVAKYLSKKSKERGGGLVYRIHDAPDPEKMQNLCFFLRGLGYNLGNKSGYISPAEINKLLKDVEGKPEEAMVQTAVLRSMQKAIYSTKNKGHYGLGFENYTHFTSPIRRYPDVLVHRLMTTYLSGKAVKKDTVKHFESVVARASEIEKESERAERASIKFKQLEYMLPKVGQKFDGVISSLAEWGIYVEEERSKVEGLVPLRFMSDDFYQLDEKNFAIVGSKSKKKFRLGDKVKVKLDSVDLDERRLTWRFV